jgi:hypothetical protein
MLCVTVRLHGFFPVAVGCYKSLRTAIRERDLAVLAVHGRKEWNLAAPDTLLPAKRYSEPHVKATAAVLMQQVRGTRVGHCAQTAVLCSWLCSLVQMSRGEYWTGSPCEGLGHGMCWLPTMNTFSILGVAVSRVLQF